MAASPNIGHALIRNASIDIMSGAIMPNYLPTKLSAVSSTSVFTADPSTDLCTITGSFPALASAVAVTFSTTGTLPAGLSTGTNYYIIKKSATTFKVATCIKNCGDLHGNTAFPEVDIDITDAGTGVHTMSTVDVATILAQSTHKMPDYYFASQALTLTFYLDWNGLPWFYDPYHYPGQLLLLDGYSGGFNNLGIATFNTSSLNTQYLFLTHGLFMDVCQIDLTYIVDPKGTSAWTLNWKTAADGLGLARHMIIGDDNIMYFVNGRYVGSLQETPGSTFDPSSSATYTYQIHALTLPQGESAQWLEQLGINLLVAGGSYSNIYPWDRSSPSFGLIIYCAETGVYRLKNINNTIYILNGGRGNIYKTQGAIVTLAAKMPEYATGYGTKDASVLTENSVVWGGIGSKNGNLIFGAQCTTNSANSGIWMLYPDGRLIIENQPSTGASVVNAIDGRGDQFYTFGYTNGVDIISTARYGSFGTVFQSALYPVSNKTTKGTFSRLELQLNQPTSGSSSQFRISYRRDISSSFIVLATYTTDGATTSFKTDIGLNNLENIQIQLEITGAGNNADAALAFEVRLFP